MAHRAIVASLLVVGASALSSASLVAAQLGSADGAGIMGRPVDIADPPGWAFEPMAFAPRHSVAYREGTRADRRTWIVLTEREPPVAEWARSSDPAAARLAWCHGQSAAFVALALDAEQHVVQLDLCPGKGLQTEMVSSANGLDSVAVELESSPPQRIVGRIRGGELGCSETGPAGEQVSVYCEVTEDYSFDAPLE